MKITPKLIDPSQMQIPSRANEADVQAHREWQKTGYLPMAYVQDALSRGLSSGQSIADLILKNIKSNKGIQ